MNTNLSSLPVIEETQHNEEESSLGRKLYTSDCTVIFLFQSPLLTVIEDSNSSKINQLGVSNESQKVVTKRRPTPQSLTTSLLRKIHFYLFIHVFVFSSNFFSLLLTKVEKK